MPFVLVSVIQGFSDSANQTYLGLFDMKNLGIFIRGTLIGTKNDSNTNKKSGEVFNYTALGINLPFTNSFGQESTITKEIRISKNKLNDAAFMQSLKDNFNNLVELEIGVGDFKNLFVANSAVLKVTNIT
jgi:hypothetical protein